MKLTRIFFIGSLFISLLNYAQPQTKIDSLEATLEASNISAAIKLSLYNQLGFEYWTVDPSTSEKYGKDALTLAIQLNDSSEMAMANRVIGVSHWSRGNFIPSLTHLFESQSLYKLINDKIGEANSTMNIGMVFTDQKDYDRALSAFFEASELFELLEQKERIGTVLTKIGSLYLETNRPHEANEFLTKALQIHRQLDFKFGIMEASNRLGLLSLQLDSLERAKDFLDESLFIARANKDQEHIIKNLENLSRIHIKSGEFGKAENLLYEAYPLAQSRSYKKWLKDILLDYKLIFQQKGEYAKALNYADRYEELKESLFNEENAAQLANLKMEHEAAEQLQALKLQQQEIAILQQKKKITQLSIITLVSILISMVIVSFLLFRYQRTRYRKRHAKVSKDLTRAKEIEEELKRTLHFKDKELTSYTMNFIRKNELLEELGGKIQTLRTKLPDQSKELNSILHLVEHNNIDKDWEDFKAIFENVHNDFFSRLKEYCPELTPNELRLCALVQMNLSIKEMAALMGISPDSVKTSRYRLRKKLGIEQGQSLSEFIMDYT